LSTTNLILVVDSGSHARRTDSDRWRRKR